MFPKFGGQIKNFVKIKDVYINGPVFDVHCKFTAVLLFFACATLSWVEYAGKPMQCIIRGAQDNDDYRKAINTFCWVNSTFTYPRKLFENTTLPMPHEAHPQETENRTFHSYYQWVAFILFFQGLIFYFPKWMWKHDENGLMKNLQGEEARKLCKAEETVKRKIELANYFVQRLKGHKMYTLKYWGYELLCLVNVITQMTLLEIFFHSRVEDKTDFENLGIFTFPGEQIMMYIFPDLTKCTFRAFGHGGTPQDLDNLCVLSLNVFNRFIFRFMWYWFMALVVILTSLLLYRMLLIFSPYVRYLLLQLPRRKKLMVETKSVAFKLDVSDWWVLYSLKKNIAPKLFEEVILELYTKLGY